MRISPLLLTIILALLTGVTALSIWALLADHFNPPGMPYGGIGKMTVDIAGPILESAVVPGRNFFRVPLRSQGDHP